MSITLDTPALDKAAGFARTALKASIEVRGLCRHLDDPDDRAALPFATNAAVDAARSAVGALQQLGATFPNMPAPVPIPLHLLDTPDTRELLERLQAALPIAERIDAARGRSLDEAFPGDAKGLDLGDAVAALIARMTTEVHGARGRE